MSEDLVTKARAMLAAATPGPWEMDESSEALYAGEQYVAEFYEGVEIPDAGLMASAPTLIADLCDEVEALRARVAELEESLEMACQAPADGCDCPGCSYAREKGGAK